MAYAGIIERYREYLPLAFDTKSITLLEGNTPLIQLHNLPDDWQFKGEVYIKYEGLNPTGSFKDRGMTVAVSQAVADDAKAIICASTGNTSAAAAAYAARAGIQAIVLVPHGQIALGKLAQAIMHGAKVLQIEGNFDQGLTLVKQLVEDLPITLVNSINPYRLEGQKTAAFEIIEQLGDAPDFHCLPVGNAGNISAYWQGYTEFLKHGKSTQAPKMLGFQATDAAPFVYGQPVANPETVATAIRIGKPASWQKAVSAQETSGGYFASVTDEEILQAQQNLASREGIFCEPASAASIAGLQKAILAEQVPAGSKVVCTLTGHGLKDPEIAIQQCADAIQQVPIELEVVKRMIV